MYQNIENKHYFKLQIEVNQILSSIQRLTYIIISNLYIFPLILSRHIVSIMYQQTDLY